MFESCSNLPDGGWLHSVVSTSALRAEGPGFAPQVAPWPVPRVRQALGARCEPGGDAPLSKIKFSGVEVQGAGEELKRGN